MRTAIRTWLLLLLILTGPVPATPAYGNRDNPAVQVSAAQDGGPAMTPDEEYVYIWRMVQENFYYRNRLEDQNWLPLKCEPLHFGSYAEAEAAMQTSLERLNEPYTGIRVYRRSDSDEVRSETMPRMLKDDIAYIPIHDFADQSVGLTRQALRRMCEARAYIIDLRGNHGGSVRAALRVFEMLVDKGPFVRFTAYRDGRYLNSELAVLATSSVEQVGSEQLRDGRERNLSGNKPMIVLVDEETASAAEMLADALQYNQRACLLGVTTFGKGLVQLVYNLRPRVQLIITSGRWRRLNHLCVHKVGIAPDIVVRRDNAGDNQLRRAMEILNP